MTKDTPVKKIITIIVIVFSLLLVGGVTVLYIVARGAVTIIKDESQKVDQTRVVVQKKYETLTLPVELTLTSKAPMGDGFDSKPGWEYAYDTSGDPAALDVIRQKFEAQGFVVEGWDAVTGRVMKSKSLGLTVLVQDTGQGTVFIDVTQF